MPNLLLCMTPGVGLNKWAQQGTISRELLLYEYYVSKGWNVKILAFDNSISFLLPTGIEFVPFSRSRLLQLSTDRKLGIWADVIKTNQSNRSWYYVFAARIWNKPLLLRCGYVHGEFLQASFGRTISVMAYQALESLAFRYADRCTVPTKALQQWVCTNYSLEPAEVSIIPNYVDTAVFAKKLDIIPLPKTVVAVGQLEEVKRFDLLIRACSLIRDCSLTIIGEGSQKANLSRLASELSVRLSLPGRLPNRDLPRELQKYMVFVATSKFEGHPKALLEALSCGMPCLVVNAPGFRELINERIGLISEATPEALSASINHLFENPSDREQLSTSAVEYVRSNYSIEKCFATEMEVVQNLLCRE